MKCLQQPNVLVRRGPAFGPLTVARLRNAAFLAVPRPAQASTLIMLFFGAGNAVGILGGGAVGQWLFNWRKVRVWGAVRSRCAMTARQKCKLRTI